MTQSGLFGNKVGPGVLRYSIQETLILQECERYKAYTTYGVLILSWLFCIFKGRVFVERSTGQLWTPSRFRNT